MRKSEIVRYVLNSSTPVMLPDTPDGIGDEFFNSIEEAMDFINNLVDHYTQHYVIVCYTPGKNDWANLPVFHAGDTPEQGDHTRYEVVHA